jgi:hypothetical protein
MLHTKYKEHIQQSVIILVTQDIRIILNTGYTYGSITVPMKAVKIEKKKKTFKHTREISYT